MSDKNIQADLSDDGDIKLKSLDATQLSVVVVTKLSAMEKQLNDISSRLATKDDIRVVNERVDHLKAVTEQNDEWIKRRSIEIEAERNSLSGKIRAKFGEYAVTVFIALLVASFVGGILFYVGHANDTASVQDEIRALKELAP